MTLRICGDTWGSLWSQNEAQARQVHKALKMPLLQDLRHPGNAAPRSWHLKRRSSLQNFGRKLPAASLKGSEVPAGIESLNASSEPERTGTRSPSQAAPSPPSRQAGSMEDELAWTVQQMEVHRRQIEAHQRQLSILERRHAELITIVSRGRGLGGPSSAGSSVAGKLFSIEDDVPSVNMAAPAPWEVASNSSSGAGAGSLGFASAMAAAEARLGLRSRGSRPTSASSGFSGAAREVANGTRTPLQRGTVPRPMSAGSGAEDAGLQSPMPPGKSGHSSPSEAAPSTANISKEREAEVISKLLNQLSLHRPLRVPFTAVEWPSEGEGQVYMHGSLEVRLFLSEDESRLLVRVSSGNGKLLEMGDFLSRAEAIEAKRRSPRVRPNTIAEETEQHGFDAPRADMTAPRAELTGSLAHSQRSLSASAQSQVSAPASPNTMQPWKNLFKAHWPAR